MGQRDHNKKSGSKSNRYDANTTREELNWWCNGLDLRFVAELGLYFAHYTVLITCSYSSLYSNSHHHLLLSYYIPRTQFRVEQ
jgi:hypothetical protein